MILHSRTLLGFLIFSPDMACLGLQAKFGEVDPHDRERKKVRDTADTVVFSLHIRFSSKFEFSIQSWLSTSESNSFEVLTTPRKRTFR